MGLRHPRKWQEELVGIAWINIALVVMSLPLFAIYIVESLQTENVKNFVLHTERGEHFMEIIVKYFVIYWVPMSIILKIGAAKPSYTLVKTCSIANLTFMFLLALQMIIEPPVSNMVVCAYAVCFLYLLASFWIMKNFLQELKSEKNETNVDTTPVIGSLNDNGICSADNYDELNDVADEKFIFRLQPLSINAQQKAADSQPES